MSRAVRALADSRIPELDGLRALAILLVIPHNADLFAHATGVLWPFALLAHAGWIGVQLFFVLSGFLITGNLIDSQQAPNYFSAFYARRMLRIFPLYYATLIVGLWIVPALVELSPQAMHSHENQIWWWIFLNNWVQPFGRDLHGYSHFWSLAVEEQFYLLWPFVIHRLALGRIFRISLALALIALAARGALLFSGGPRDMAYMFTFCRMDALALGAAAAALVRMPGVVERLARHRRWLLAMALTGGLAGALGTHVYDVSAVPTLTAGHLLLSIVFASLILYVVIPHNARGRDALCRILRSKAMRSIGQYSFAMYVFHLPIGLIVPFRAFEPLGSDIGRVMYVLVVILLSFVAGAASFHLFEKHFLKMKRWFVPMPRPTSQPAD